MRVITEDSGLDPTFPAGFQPSSYAEATAITLAPGSDTVYTADAKRDWCIGYGMYLASLSHGY
jgi:hypothetical protein